MYPSNTQYSITIALNAGIATASRSQRMVRMYECPTNIGSTPLRSSNLAPLSNTSPLGKYPKAMPMASVAMSFFPLEVPVAPVSQLSQSKMGNPVPL